MEVGERRGPELAGQTECSQGVEKVDVIGESPILHNVDPGRVVQRLHVALEESKSGQLSEVQSNSFALTDKK